MGALQTNRSRAMRVSIEVDIQMVNTMGRLISMREMSYSQHSGTQLDWKTEHALKKVEAARHGRWLKVRRHIWRSLGHYPIQAPAEG